jgi:hypothetical protein
LPFRVSLASSAMPGCAPLIKGGSRFYPGRGAVVFWA